MKGYMENVEEVLLNLRYRDETQSTSSFLYPDVRHTSIFDRDKTRRQDNAHAVPAFNRRCTEPRPF